MHGLTPSTWGSDLSGSQQGAGGVGGLVMEKDAATGDVYFPSFDGNGNVTNMVAAGSGSIAATYEYDPFGKVVSSSGSYADANPYRFSTKFNDSETNWLYYGYRFYNPVTGRWISRDPIEEEGGVNMYGFVKNNPIGRIDPLGLAYIEASAGDNLSTVVWDFLNPNMANTWMFRYPHSVAKRFQQHPGAKWMWDLYFKDIQKYCSHPSSSGQRQKTWQGRFTYTANLGQFFIDAATFLGWYGEGYSHGDFGTNVIGSFRVDYRLTVDCTKCRKTAAVTKFDRLTVASLTRNPFNRQPLMRPNILPPTPIYILYNLDLDLNATSDSSR